MSIGITTRSMGSLSGDGAYRDGRLTPAALASLAILTFITFLGNFTQLQLTSALPTIVHAFGISVTLGQWLTAVFQLVMGVMVPLTAFLVRRFTTRQIVLVSMLAFTGGSALAWLSPVFSLVLLGRALEAAGTGIMWPLLQILVFSIYPLAKRGEAMGTVGLAMSVGPAIGPVIGGWQTDQNGWRSIFLSLTVIGLASLVVSALWLRDFGRRDTSARVDLLSVGLSVVGFGGLMFGFTNIEAYPLRHPMVWATMLVGAAGIAWFVVRQLRGRAPLLDLRVLRNRAFTTGTVVASAVFFAFSSIAVILPLYIQTDRGYSATMSGLVMLPGAFGTAIAQFFGGRALDHHGARPVALIGGMLLTLGTLGMGFMGHTTPIWSVSVLQFVRMTGMGLVLMPITTWLLNRLPAGAVSAGSAVTNTIRQIAGAAGGPLLVVTMEQLTRWRAEVAGPTEASIFGVQWTLRLSALICALALVLVAFGVRGPGAVIARQGRRRPLPPSPRAAQ